MLSNSARTHTHIHKKTRTNTQTFAHSKVAIADTLRLGTMTCLFIHVCVFVCCLSLYMSVCVYVGCLCCAVLIAWVIEYRNNDVARISHTEYIRSLQTIVRIEALRVMIDLCGCMHFCLLREPPLVYDKPLSSTDTLFTSGVALNKKLVKRILNRIRQPISQEIEHGTNCKIHQTSRRISWWSCRLQVRSCVFYELLKKKQINSVGDCFGNSVDE